MSMSPRERVLAALNHDEPDRVPLFIGTSGATTVLGPGYETLKTHLGVRGGPAKWFSRTLQYAWMDEEVMERLGSDGRPAAPGPAPSVHRREISDDLLVDEWGGAWQRSRSSGYMEILEPPLRGASLADLERYAWPDLAHSSRFEGLRERCCAIRDAGFAVVLLTGVTLFEQMGLMRGMADLLIDTAADEDFFSAFIGKLKGLMLPYVRELFRRVGDCVDVVITGDDLGTQESTMVSPAAYRRLIKPHQAEVLGAIHQGTKASVFFHSCGNIYPLIGDLVEIGVDLLNPIQVSTPGLADTARLKREFGAHLSFCGAIDTHDVLPHGSPADVRAEVRRRIRDLAPGGGYVAASVHCIQPDVPPENIVAMCEEVKSAGRYPLRV